MSETNADPAPAVAPAPRPRKWRRRLWRLALVLLGLAVVIRTAAQFLAQPILQRAFAMYGLDVSYDNMDLYLLGGDVGLWGLRLVPKSGGEPVLSVGYCRAAIAPLALLRGQLRVRRVEAEGTTLSIERMADGRIPLIESIIGARVATMKPGEAGADTGATSLDPPLVIDTARLQQAALRFRDRSMTPTADFQFSLNALITGVAAGGPPAVFEIQLHSPETLDAVYLSGWATSRDNVLDADVALRIHGLNLIPAKAYLEPLGIIPVSNDLSARANGKLQAKVTGGASSTQPSTPLNLSATLDLSDLRLLSGSTEAATVRSVKVDARTVSSDLFRVEQVLVDGVRASVHRTAQGRLGFGSIELGPVEPVAEAPQAGGLPAIDVRQLLVQDVELTFTDHALPQPVQLSFVMPELLVENFCTETAQATGPTALSLAASAPGLARSISIDGTAIPSGAASDIQLSVRISGIEPRAADAYLAAARLKSDLKDGEFTCAITGRVEPRADGSLAASFSVSDSSLVAAGQTLLSMPLVEISQVQLDPDMSHISLGVVRLNGPVVSVRRSETGVVEALGLRYDPAMLLAATSGSPPEAPPATGPAPAAQPLVTTSLAIGKVEWREASIQFADSTAQPPTEISLADFVLDCDNLVFGESSTAAPPGRIHVSLKSPGLIETFLLDGSLAPSPRTLEFDLKAQSTGISTENLKGMLSAMGLEPVMKQGAAEFALAGKLGQADGRLLADFDLRDARLSEPSDEWLSLGGLSVQGASFDGKALEVGSITIDKPAVRVMRDAQGAVSLAGVKVLPPRPATPTTAPAAPSVPAEARLDLSLPIVAKIKSLQLRDASVNWSDGAVLPQAQVSASLNANASDLLAGSEGPPSEFSLTLSSPGVIESLTLQGTATLAPHRQQVELTARGEGITGRALDAYLPPNIATRFQNGRFDAKVSALIEPNAQGGTRAQLAITDLALRDGVAADPVAGLRAMRIGIDRLDLAANLIDISEIAVEGAGLAVEQNEDGIALLGLTLAPQLLRPASPEATAPEPMASGAASDVSAMVAQSHEPPPLIIVQRLSVGADRISFASPTLAKPLTVTDLALVSPGKIELLGDDPTQRPPVKLEFRATVDGLVDSVAVDANLAPFAAEPSVRFGVDVSGIRGEQLPAFMPQLAETVDGSGLSDGRVTASFESQFGYTRRGALGIDLTRGITATFELKDLKLVQSGVQTPLAGVQAIHGEGVRYSPHSGSLAIKSLDVTTPQATVLRDQQGIHLLGLTLKAPATQPATAPQDEAPEVAPVAQADQAPSPAATTPADPAKAAPEYRIDRFTVSGIDLTIEDRVGSPPTLLTINQLDLEVRGLSSRALAEPDRPIRFSAVVGAGKVPLPPQRPRDGDHTELREAFAEASAAGNVTLVPRPQGFVKASLSGLELAALRGLAEEYGVTLEGGIFDVRADVRMEGAETFDARLFPTFTELRLSEPSDGPIQSALKLPVPLDAAIKTLEDADGSISFTLTVPMEAGQIGWGPVIASASSSLSGVLAGALVAAPLKAGRLVPMLVGADASEARGRGLEPVAIEFLPGESRLSNLQRDQIRAAAETMWKDRSVVVTVQHTLGSDDDLLVQARANPPASASLAVAERLRGRKAELQRQLRSLEGQLQAAMFSQNEALTQGMSESTRRIAAELAATEEALDQALDLLRPGADRQAQRRTRASAIRLAELRLHAVQDALLESDVGDVADRVRKATALYNVDQSQPLGRVTIVLTRQARK
jgi:uncharacterized protein involved in outer membrane biogenesis